jgi:hypothetical protein
MGTTTTTVQSGSVGVTDNSGTTTVLTAGQQLTITDSVPPLFAALLPSSRSVQVGTPAGKGGRTRWAGVPAAERARLMEKVRAARAKKRKRRT